MIRKNWLFGFNIKKKQKQQTTPLWYVAGQQVRTSNKALAEKAFERIIC
jgi:hypothetical protein